MYTWSIQETPISKRTKCINLELNLGFFIKCMIIKHVNFVDYDLTLFEKWGFRLLFGIDRTICGFLPHWPVMLKNV